MKISDLKGGMRIETGEDMYILIGDTLIDGDGGFLDVGVYDDSLANTGEPPGTDFHIQRVFGPPSIENMFNFDKKGPLLWDRHSSEHMIKGKPYSEETIHLALKAYIGD